MPAVMEISADAMLVNMWTNRTLRQIRRTGVDRFIPISTPIHSGMSKSSIPGSSDSTRTRGTGIRIPIGNTAPCCGLNVSLKIDDIRQPATPNLRNSNKLDTSIDRKLTNNLVAPPIFTDLIYEKLYNSSIWDIYTSFQMNFVANTVNIPAPQFVDLGISTIDTLDKGSSIWTPVTIFGRPMDVTHWSARDQIFGKTTPVGDVVSAKSDYNYKTDFETWRKNHEF